MERWVVHPYITLWSDEYIVPEKLVFDIIMFLENSGEQKLKEQLLSIIKNTKEYDQLKPLYDYDKIDITVIKK